MKKLRAILRLIKPCVTPTTMKTIRREARSLRKACAMSRDQHVMNALLLELGDDSAANHKERLAPENADGPDGLPSPKQLLKLKATAQRLSSKLETLSLTQLTWDDTAKAYARRYAKVRQWFRRCENKPTSARLHRWRTPVKDHYFQSLIVLPHPHHCKEARKLGRLLGQMHDLAMLREHYDDGGTSNLAHPIHLRMKGLRARIFRQAKRLLSLTPRKLKRLARNIHK